MSSETIYIVINGEGKPIAAYDHPNDAKRHQGCVEVVSIIFWKDSPLPF